MKQLMLNNVLMVSSLLVIAVSWKTLLYLAALSRASRPASHSRAQMDSFTFDALKFADFRLSRKIVSPLSISSLTNVALVTPTPTKQRDMNGKRRIVERFKMRKFRA